MDYDVRTKDAITYFRMLMKNSSDQLGVAPVKKLLLQQSIPAMIGFMVMSVYMLVDVFFVSRFVGKVAIAGINIVLPITFLIAEFLAHGFCQFLHPSDDFGMLILDVCGFPDVVFQVEQ